jgi:hypothetical protein
MAASPFAAVPAGCSLPCLPIAAEIYNSKMRANSRKPAWELDFDHAA